MDEEKQEIKVSKSYSLRPSQITWLRKKAIQESTAEEIVSASAVLERIIDKAIQESEQSPSQKKRSAASAQIALVA